MCPILISLDDVWLMKVYNSISVTLIEVEEAVRANLDQKAVSLL